MSELFKNIIVAEMHFYRLCATIHLTSVSFSRHLGLSDQVLACI